MKNLNVPKQLNVTYSIEEYFDTSKRTVSDERKQWGIKIGNLS